MSLPLILDGTYFKISEELKDKDLSSNVNVKAICLLCPKRIEIRGSLKSTSNFTTHLKRVHPESIDSFEKYKKDNKTPGRKIMLNRPSHENNLKQTTLGNEFFRKKQNRQEQLNENILSYVINSMKPLSTVEDVNFIKIVKDLDADITIMSRRTLSRKITDRDEFVRSNLKTIIKWVPFVSTTADIWSTKYRSYMGVTVHWIEPKTLVRKSAVLACKRFVGVHTYEKIAEILIEITREFDLNHQKIMSTVTDNGSNFVKAFKEFGYSCDDEIDSSDIVQVHNDLDTDIEGDLPLPEHHIIRPDAEEVHNVNDDLTYASNVVKDVSETTFLLPLHLRCASHTLSLLATADYIKILKDKHTASKIHFPAIGKCTFLWNAARRPKTAEIIKSTIDTQLIFPTATRWNSLYDAIHHLLKHKEKLNILFTKIGIHCTFKQLELEYLEEYCFIFKPIALALDSLQGQNDCYYGQLYPTLFSLKIKLERLQSQNVLRYCNGVLLELIKCLEQRFKLFFEFSPEMNHALIATCLHPLFKMRWLPDIDNPTKIKIQSICLNAIEKNKRDHQLLNGSLSSSGDLDQEDDAESFFVFDSTSNHQQTLNKSNLELELIKYLGDKNKSFEILNNYPNIKRAFAKYNTSLCSSAPVERLFSLAGFINSPARGSLSDGVFEKLVFLKGNEEFFSK